MTCGFAVRPSTAPALVDLVRSHCGHVVVSAARFGVAVPLRGEGHYVGDPFRRVLCDGRYDVRVPVRREAGRAVPEPDAHDLHCNVRGQRETGPGIRSMSRIAADTAGRVGMTARVSRAKITCCGLASRGIGGA